MLPTSGEIKAQTLDGAPELDGVPEIDTGMGSQSPIEQQFARGLQFANTVGAMNRENIKEDKALLHSVVEMLIGQGVIHLYQLERKKRDVSKRIEETGAYGPEVNLVKTPDKYGEVEKVEIDCESRYPICKGACCKLWFSLSVQDLEEGILKWNYARPYGIAQGKDGRCVHQDRATFKCKVYNNRPHVCRTYDCSKDTRIWLDFEKRVINPAILRDDWSHMGSESSSEYDPTEASNGEVSTD